MPRDIPVVSILKKRLCTGTESAHGRILPDLHIYKKRIIIIKN